MTINVIDSTETVRLAILAALKADAGVISQVPTSRIYPSRTPATLTWPFIRMGVTSELPFRPSGAYGSQTIIGAVHVFTKSQTGSLDAERAANLAKKEVARVLDGLVVAITGGYANVRYDGGQTIQDAAEADAYHGIVNYEATCVVD